MKEFLWTIGDDVSYPLIQKCYEAGKPLGQEMNRELLRQFRCICPPGECHRLLTNAIKQTAKDRKVICLPVYMVPFI